ncbi:MAG: RHS repeat-associated core domain-containing protein [Bacteroidota bacterium]
MGTAYSALFSSFDATYGSGVEGGISSSSTVFDEALNGIDMSGKGNSSTAPRAFLNYLFFDQEMNYVRAGFLQITTAAQGIGVHQTISLNDIIADREGYLLGYLSNENKEVVNIHFDDFAVYHSKTNVVYSSDYYPFGYQYNEYQRTASTDVRYRFQEQEYDKRAGLNVFKYRDQDPLTGRFLQVDPISEEREWLSPYNFVQNNPINRVDPDGALDWVLNGDNEIYWDDNANSQATTQAGETYLGKELTFTFNSNIAGGLWDGPGGSAPVGDKLTSTVTLSASENSDGQLTGISATSNIQIGSTPIGTARDYFPGLLTVVIQD